MRLDFNNKQLKLLENMEFDFDVSGNLSEEELEVLDESVSDYLVTHGLDGDDVNHVGIVCESILDMIAEL